jgi:hypothetical protein
VTGTNCGGRSRHVIDGRELQMRSTPFKRHDIHEYCHFKNSQRFQCPKDISFLSYSFSSTSYQVAERLLTCQSRMLISLVSCPTVLYATFLVPSIQAPRFRFGILEYLAGSFSSASSLSASLPLSSSSFAGSLCARRRLNCRLLLPPSPAPS